MRGVETLTGGEMWPETALATFTELLETAVGDPAGLSDAEIVGLLVRIRDCRAGLAVLASTLELAVAQRHGPDKWVVDNVGEVQVRRSVARRAWRHDELIPAVIARIIGEPATIYDPETGELLPYAQIAANITVRLRDCVSFGAGKVTGLRALGLQPDEFCEQDDAHYSVQLPRRP